MWELIRANKRKSWLLFFAMGICLLALGYGLGAAVDPMDGGWFGITIAALVWTVLSLVGFFSGDQILLAASRAKEITRDIHPQLFNVVEEMKIAANLPAIPRIYIIDETAPNAFATGRKPERSAVAITTGLLAKLNRDELQGVVAHEISHILNRDILFMTFAGILLGSIVLISDMYLRGMRYSSGSSNRYRSGSSSRGTGQAQALFFVVALLLAILAPIAAQLLYLAISRRREYLADASGARLTRYPEGLASALEKIAASDAKLSVANAVTAPMYIVNPLKGKSFNPASLMSTHPPIEMRIQILRAMSQGVNYANYQKAYSAITGQSALIIPPSCAQDVGEIAVRAGVSEPRRPSAKDEIREMGDLTRAINQFTFLSCPCGLKIKVPPDFKQSEVVCPKCWRTLEVPDLQTASIRR